MLLLPFTVPWMAGPITMIQTEGAKRGQERAVTKDYIRRETRWMEDCSNGEVQELAETGRRDEK